MRIFIAVAVAVIAAGVIGQPAQAQNRLKECATQWNALKAANQTAGKTYREFQKGCMGKSDDLARQAGASDIKSDKPAKTKSAKLKSSKATKDPAKTSATRAATNARRSACGAEWKADKAAGKIVAGMKWPQYWSACNKRKKGEAA
jgi:Sec-independent protein translocase protein TatA